MRNDDIDTDASIDRLSASFSAQSLTMSSNIAQARASGPGFLAGSSSNYGINSSGIVLSGGGGGVSVATVVPIPVGRVAHTEKVASILKKQEVLKDLEEEMKRKRAVAHRSVDFVGSRGARRAASRDMLEDIPSMSPSLGQDHQNPRASTMSTKSSFFAQLDPPSLDSAAKLANQAIGASSES
eukprot:jgi/Hompol1/4100/HPOL_006925-RA